MEWNTDIEKQMATLKLTWIVDPESKKKDSTLVIVTPLNVIESAVASEESSGAGGADMRVNQERRGVLLVIVLVGILVSGASIANRVQHVVSLEQQDRQASRHLQLRILVSDATRFVIQEINSGNQEQEWRWEMTPENWSLTETGTVVITKAPQETGLLNVRGELTLNNNVTQRMTRQIKIQSSGE